MQQETTMSLCIGGDNRIGGEKTIVFVEGTVAHNRVCSTGRRYI